MLKEKGKYFRPKIPKRNKRSAIQALNMIRKMGWDEALARLSDYQDPAIEKRHGDDGGLTYTAIGDRPISTEAEAVEFFQVDTERWEVKAIRHNSWDVSMKMGNAKDGFCTEKRTNYQTRLDLAPRTESIIEQLDGLKAEIPRLPAVKKRGPDVNNGVLLELMITDLHIGKVGFDPHTLEFNWSPEEALRIYADCVSYLLEQVDEPIEKIVIPTGNDLLHINSDQNTTKKGTQMHTGDMFGRLFVRTRETICAIVDEMQEKAPVEIVMVPGNHDADAVFSLGDSLSVRYENSTRVSVNNDPIRRKYVRFGKSLIGYDHGDKAKVSDLFHAPGQDRPLDFGETEYRYMHIGHLHKNAVYPKFWKEEKFGVEVEICPSLSPIDQWHYEKLFVGNVRRTKAFVYDRDKGKISEHYFNLEER